MRDGRGDESLRRRSSRREQGKTVLIVCDGEKTEPAYFRRLRDGWNLRPVQIVAGQGDGDPKTIVDRAVRMRDEHAQSNADGFDEVWCVYDSDSRTRQQLNNALTLANSEGIQVALSVPCFEFWFLLHYVFTTSPHMICSSVISALKDHIAGYEKNSSPSDELMERTDEALGNAKQLRSDSVVNQRGYPRTDVDKLVQELKSLKR